MKRRIVAFLLTALMVMGTFALTAFAVDPVEVDFTIKVDQVEVEKSATEVTVGIWFADLTDDHDIGTVDIRVKYDDTKLKMTDVYAEVGSGRNKVYYGAACFEGGYQFSEPGSTTNPLVFIAWTTTKTNPGYDSVYEMNTYEFALIDFDIIGDWEGRTPLELSFGDMIDRPNDAPLVGFNVVDGYVQRGEYTEPEEPVEDNTLFVAAEGNGTVDATIAGATTAGITEQVGFAPKAGDAVTLEAKGEGFKFWKNAASGAIISDVATLSWTDAGSVRNLVAVFADEVTETNTVVFKDSRTGKIHGTKEVATGTALTAADFPADPSLFGLNFTGWKVAVEGAQSVNALDYVVESDLEVYAAYTADSATTKVLTVNDGKRTKDFDRTFASIATVYADIEGFSYWKDDQGTIVSLDPVYKFTMPNRDVTLTAVANEAAPDYILAMVENKAVDGAIYTTFTRDLAEDCTLVEAGVLYTRKATVADLVVPKTNNTVTQGISTAAATDSVFGFVKTAGAGNWLVRGYMVYVDANGATQTVYTAVSSVEIA